MREYSAKLRTRQAAASAKDSRVLAAPPDVIAGKENVRGLDMDRSDDDPDYPTAPPRVVRYGAPLGELARRAVAETRGLAGCS